MDPAIWGSRAYCLVLVGLRLAAGDVVSVALGQGPIRRRQRDLGLFESVERPSSVDWTIDIHPMRLSNSKVQPSFQLTAAGLIAGINCDMNFTARTASSGPQLGQAWQWPKVLNLELLDAPHPSALASPWGRYESRAVGIEGPALRTAQHYSTLCDGEHGPSALSHRMIDQKKYFERNRSSRVSSQVWPANS
jgi:hypothetical protein